MKRPSAKRVSLYAGIAVSVVTGLQAATVTIVNRQSSEVRGSVKK
jgi:hypothetical protein